MTLALAWTSLGFLSLLAGRRSPRVPQTLFLIAGAAFFSMALVLAVIPGSVPGDAPLAAPQAPEVQPLPIVNPVPGALSLDWQRIALRYPNVARWGALIEEVSREPGCNVPPSWLAAVVAQESQGEAEVVNQRSYATGLMQVIPQEAVSVLGNHAWIRARPPMQALKDPAFNLRYGCRILWEELDRFKLDPYLALAAYNAGASRVVAAGGVPENGETEVYVPKVLAYRARFVGGKPGTCCASTPLQPMPAVFKPFGAAVDYQAGGRHTGIDVAGARVNGEEPLLYAVDAGEVVHVGALYCDAYKECRGGNVIVLDHGNDIYSVYSHNSEAFVAAEERVWAGQEIGRQGNEGYSFGSHIHLELVMGCEWSGNWRDPWSGCNGFVNPVEYLP